MLYILFLSYPIRLVLRGHSKLGRFVYRSFENGIFDRKHYLLFLTLLILVTSQFLILKVDTSVIGSTTTILYAIADAYVNETSPDTNYGSNDTLIINFNSHNCFAYIMFNLSSIPSEATLISAMLRVYAASGSWK